MYTGEMPGRYGVPSFQTSSMFYFAAAVFLLSVAAFFYTGVIQGDFNSLFLLKYQ